jgi:hypothetical protein
VVGPVQRQREDVAKLIRKPRGRLYLGAGNAPAEAHWVAFVNAAAENTVYLGCKSWYVGANVPGKPHVFMPLAGGFPAYAKRCAAVADSGYEGFVLET